MNCLPPAGWLPIEVLPGECTRPWCGSKEARRMIFNQECPPRFLITVEGRTVMSVIIGIDPHKALHAACAIDRTENQLAAFNVHSGTRQVSQLLEWASPFVCRTWAIESPWTVRVSARPAARRSRRARR